MVQWVRHLVHKPEDLNSDPRSLVKGKEKPASQDCLWLPHVYSGIHGPPTIQIITFKYNDKIKTNCVL